MSPTRAAFTCAAALLLCLGAPAFAQDVARTEDRRITVIHQGTVREILLAIEAQGGLDLDLQGDLDAPAAIVLRDVTPEEALQTVSEGWRLEAKRDGGVWTVRERGAAAATRAAPAPPPTAEEVKSAGNRVLFGKSGAVGADEVVDKVVVYGGSLRVDGRVVGNAAVFGGSLELGPGAVVEGNVDTFGGSVFRHQGAQIQGRVRTFGGEVTEVPAGSDVAAVTSAAKAEAARAEAAAARAEREAEAAEERAAREASDSDLADFLTWFAVLFGIGFGAAMLAPARMKVVQDEIRRAPGRSTAVGALGAFILMPIASILLTITIVGILLLPVLWTLVAAAVFVGFTSVASELGARLPVFRGRKSQALVLALGLLTILLLALVPGLGALAVTLFALCGFGAILRTRFGRRSKAPASVLRDDLPAGVAL